MGTGLAASWRPCTTSWRHCLHHLGRGLVLEAPIARDEETRALALKSRHHISSEEQHFVFVLLQGDQGIHEACDPNNPPHIGGQRAFAASPSPAKLEPFQGKSLTSITRQILDNLFGNHIMFYNSCSQVSKVFGKMKGQFTNSTMGSKLSSWPVQIGICLYSISHGRPPCRSACWWSRCSLCPALRHHDLLDELSKSDIFFCIAGERPNIEGFLRLTQKPWIKQYWQLQHVMCNLNWNG